MRIAFGWVHELWSYPIRLSLVLIHAVIGSTIFYTVHPRPMPLHYSAVSWLAGPEWWKTMLNWLIYHSVSWLAGPYWWVTVFNWIVGLAILIGLISPRLYAAAKVSLGVSLVFFNALVAALLVSSIHAASNFYGAGLCLSFSLVNVAALRLPAPSQAARKLRKILET